MSANSVTQTTTTQHDNFVKVQVLSAGHLTLPEGQFVYPASETARSTVPSLAFLIEHISVSSGKQTRILFDLGLRRETTRYAPPIQKHLATRQPLSTDPDVTKSLSKGGLKPSDIDYVIYSHVHWDHIGEPLDFPKSTFVVGNGALDLLSGSSKSLRGGHSFFEADLLDQKRTIELEDPELRGHGDSQSEHTSTAGEINLLQPWTSIQDLPSVIDLFQDQSIYIVNAPGHLPGHINLLARTGPSDWVYLAGDACHDRRILRKEREIGEWLDAEGHTCCIHVDRKTAEETIERIRKLEQRGVEVIFAHDVEWEKDPKNSTRIWGA